MTTDEVLKGLIWNDKNQLIESVLDMGADINAKDSDGETPVSLSKNSPTWIKCLFD